MVKILPSWRYDFIAAGERATYRMPIVNLDALQSLLLILCSCLLILNEYNTSETNNVFDHLNYFQLN